MTYDVTKNPDGTFTVLNLETGESRTMSMRDIEAELAMANDYLSQAQEIYDKANAL